MAGICSKHHPDLGPIKGCIACHSSPEDIIGMEEFQKLRDDVIKAGVIQCRKCRFVYYKPVRSCPLCLHPLERSTTTILGSWWIAVKKWLATIGH